MTSIRFHVNAEKPRAPGVRDRLAAQAERLGLAVLGDGTGEADAVVVLGGDGTLLRAVHAYPGVPLLGLNLGGLGYLASVGADDFEAALALLAAGRYRISGRTALRVNGFDALNDVVVMREMTGHAAVLDLAVDGRSATRYMADGLVVATPTGSTAYSLAAGGPVLMPDSRSFVVTPMNPHALGVRPMVVSDSVRLRVSSRRHVNGKAEKTGVYADGEHVMMLDGGESVEIEKSDRVARLIELEGYDPYEVLNRKLGWSK